MKAALFIPEGVCDFLLNSSALSLEERALKAGMAFDGRFGYAPERLCRLVGARGGREESGVVSVHGVDYRPWTAAKWPDKYFRLQSFAEANDAEFTLGMEDAAQAHDCWIEPGEGDPCDMFLRRHK